MSTFLYIITNIITPIFLLVSVGFIAQKKLKMDSRTFSRINIYILVPAVLFTKIYEADVTIQFVGIVFAYIMIIEALMMILGELISNLLKHPKPLRKAFGNSLLFFNSGNYGLPLVEMAFNSNPLATASQVFIMLFQNITTNTLGVFQASSGKFSRKQSIRNVLGMPTIYVLMIVLLVRAVHFKVPEQLMLPLKYISGGFIGLALITLGVQLAEIKMSFKLKDVMLSTFIRLIASPLIGTGLVLLFGIKGVLAQSLIIGASTPTAVNTAIIAREFDNEPEYASQIVLVSTILSTVTISIVLFMVKKFF